MSYDAIARKLTADELAWIRRLCREKLGEYFGRRARSYAPSWCEGGGSMELLILLIRLATAVVDMIRTLRTKRK